MHPFYSTMKATLFSLVVAELLDADEQASLAARRITGCGAGIEKEAGAGTSPALASS
jgi:hypothetical protein